MAKKTVFIAVAILCAFELDGQRYTPGQVVEFVAATANDLADQGQVDKHKDAVMYAMSQGAKEIRHTGKDPDTETDETPPDDPAAIADNHDSASVE